MFGVTSGGRVRFAERCREAGVDGRRFINVLDGEKGTRTPGHQNPENWLTADDPRISGNYGIHPGPASDSDGPVLVEFDIDDYDRERDRSALEELPKTLAVKSPHTDPGDPGHLYFSVTGDVATTLREVAGNLNPEPVWGEIKSEGKYVVGPGSQLDGCTKEWCDECARPNGGYYEIAVDVPIATITVEQLADVLRDDPDIQGWVGGGAHVLNDSGEIDGQGWVGDEAKPPEDLPMCYRAALAARAGGASVSKHKVNVYIGLLGLNCGYEVREVADHIREVDPSIDVSETEYHLDHIRKNQYSPPALRTLARAGILPAPICHGECPIHGGDDKFAGGGDVDHVAVLPHSPRARAAASGWDWQSADRADTGLTIDSARERTSSVIADAYETGNRVLIEALPTIGKTYGAVAAAAEIGAPITVLTGRGNEEQYEQLREWCEEHGLRAKVLSSVWRDCETFQGEYGEAIEETVKSWYQRGATGKDIHKNAELELGEPLPCDGPAGRRCSYKIRWQFDSDEYDVLIGNYLHAHVASAVNGRTVVVDEFPDSAFETVLDIGLPGFVSHFLQQQSTLPFDDHAELLEYRDDPERRAKALAWFQDHAPERDGTLAFAAGEGHAAAPLAAYTILAGSANDLGNGWERASLPGFDGGVGLYDRENGRVHLHTPPDLRYTRGVVGLDGTPTPRLWEIALGTRLNHRPVLTDAERGEYVRNTLGLNIVRTTDAVKLYSGSADHVAVRQDRALLETIADEHGQKPSLLTTQTAEDVYGREGVLEDVADVDHYGNLKGSNERAVTRLGAVIGSRNFGDHFVEKWGALAGEAVAEPDRSSAETRGVNLSYGEGIGDDVLRHIREHETLQALMRFGRDGRRATVYVHTNTLPEWVEGALAGQGRVIQTWPTGCVRSSGPPAISTSRPLPSWPTTPLSRLASGRFATTYISSRSADTSLSKPKGTGSSGVTTASIASVSMETSNLRRSISRN